MTRIDSASRVIAANAHTIYAALTDPQAMAHWRAPEGMHGEVLSAEARPGGKFRMALHYDDPAQEGKSGGNSDIFESRFVSLIADERVVEEVDFVSDDPAFSGTMIITTSLAIRPEGTEVTIACTNVPPGISQADHIVGLTSSLDNLATWCTS